MFFLINARDFWQIFASQIYRSHYGNCCVASSQGLCELRLHMLEKGFKVRDGRVCKTINADSLPLLFDHSNGKTSFKNALVHGYLLAAKSSAENLKVKTSKLQKSRFRLHTPQYRLTFCLTVAHAYF